ncbi:MAG: hypothetical protein QM820_24880 [Minicystis sp.]
METPPTFARDLQQVRRNRWILGLAMLPSLGVIAAIVAGLTVKAAFFAFTLHPAILAMVALLYAWRRNPWPTVERVPVRADGDGVRVGDTYLPRAEIRDGFVLPGPTPMVKLRRRRALPVDLRVGSTAEGRDLLRALGLDVSQTVATFRTMSRAVAKRRYIATAVGVFTAVYVGFISGIVNARHGHAPLYGAAMGILFALGLIGLVVVMLMPTKLSVGADGVVLRWFGRDRFIGYGEVAHVLRYDKGWGRSRYIGVTLLLRSGEEVHLPIGQATWQDEIVSIIEERLNEAMEAFHGGAAAADAALLRRGERGVSDWVTALRAIGSGANADMRTAPLPRERLFRIVESPTAPAADRAAAAVALGGDLDLESRLRLKRAAEAIAAPRLRVVLETASTGADQAELEAALTELAEQEAKTAKA